MMAVILLIRIWGINQVALIARFQSVFTTSLGAGNTG